MTDAATDRYERHGAPAGFDGDIPMPLLVALLVFLIAIACLYWSEG